MVGAGKLTHVKQLSILIKETVPLGKPFLWCQLVSHTVSSAEQSCHRSSKTMGCIEGGREKRRGGREKREASLLCSASESITAETISAEILSKAT